MLSGLSKRFPMLNRQMGSCQPTTLTRPCNPVGNDERSSAIISQSFSHEITQPCLALDVRVSRPCQRYGVQLAKDVLFL